MRLSAIALLDSLFWGRPAIAITPQTFLSGKRVLVVEDDDRLYGALKGALEDMGCEIFGSCARLSGPVDTVPRSRLDAALIDLEQLSPTRASIMVSRLDERGVPIVLITRRRSSELPTPLQTHHRLMKPFSEEELLDGVTKVIGRA